MENKAQIDAQEAIKVIENNKNNKYSLNNFKGYSPCYEFSNENLNEYYNESIGEKTLTVCGSGDQILCAILYGAKKIDCFDSNPLTYYTMMLKLYLIKNLNFETFLEFYNLINTSKNKLDIYKEIRQYIDKEDIRIFWDEIFKKTNDIKYIYINEKQETKTLYKTIPYLTKENYLKLKNNINNCIINFITCDIFKIFEHFKDTYDFINFSNIFDYINDIETILKFCRHIKTAKENFLNTNGTIIINYTWNNQSETTELATTLIEDTRKKIINQPYKEGINSITYLRKK